MLFLAGLSLAFSIAMCIHAVRSGQQMYWLFIILAFQPIGGLVYLFVILRSPRERESRRTQPSPC